MWAWESGMKRRQVIAGVVAAVIAAGIWLAVAWAGRGRSDYSGTVETREIRIGSKVGAWSRYRPKKDKG
jgi:hypothetical protein